MGSRMAMAEKLSIPQLQQAIQSGSLPAYVGIPLMQEKMKLQKSMQAMGQQQGEDPSVAEQVMREAQQEIEQETLAQRMQERMQPQMRDPGIDQLPSNLPTYDAEEMGMAGGGIVAFADEGRVVDPYSSYGDIDPLAQFSGLTQADVDRDNRRRLGIQREEQRKADIKKREFLMQNAPGSVASFDFGAGEFEALNNPPTPAPQARQADAALDNQMLVDSNVSVAEATSAPTGRGNPNAPAGGATQPTAQAAQTAEPAQKSALDQYAEMLMAERGEDAKERQQAKYMALIQAGLGIAGGTSPNALANIAQGALPATQAYQSALSNIKKSDRDRLKQLMELGVSKEKLGLEARKLGIEDKKVEGLLARYATAGAGAGSAAEIKRDQLAFRFFESLSKDKLMSGKTNEEIWEEAQRMAGKALGGGASTPTGTTTVDWGNLGNPKK
jgi:hypothetical protein